MNYKDEMKSLKRYEIYEIEEAYKKLKEIKENIKIHLIQTSKFKTNLIATFLSLPLEKESVTKNALIPAVLKRGTKNLKTQEEISIELENMYGADIDAGIDKIGDNQIIKFYLETLNDNFLPQQENLLEKSINLLLDIILNPLVEKDKFKEEYVETEKQTVKRLIDGKIDNKDRYAFNRCIEEMYKDEPFGIYKYGYIEDLEKITSEELYMHYKELIENCKIDINYQQNKMYSKIEIQDYGSGILEKDLPHIFERFYKGENSSSESIGIGLALSKSIIEKNNGYIIVDSK